MKFVIVAILIAAISAELLLTPEYVEHLKKTVEWEVADYEENIFKGWTVDEFRAILGDEDKRDQHYPNAKIAVASSNQPASINWQGANCIHEIRNQDDCGSCWAFAATSVTSDKCCLQNKDYGWLSPQELVSCDTEENKGCDGGLASNALKYVHANGLVPESCYEYTAEDDDCPTECDDGKSWKDSHVCKCGTVVDCGTVPLMKECLKKGPITARMKVYRDFTSYRKGVYCWDKKSSFEGGHAIRCVGYSDTPRPNLVCANSWGTSWGNQGYFNIGAEEDCGLRVTPQDAWTVEDC